MDCKKTGKQGLLFHGWFVVWITNLCKIKPNTMKKKVNVLSYVCLVAFLALIFSQGAMAQDYPIPVIQDNYWIDSLKIIPQTAHAGDIIHVAAYTTHSSGGCDLRDYRIWKCSNVIIVDATYEQGMLTYICHSADTIPLGTLPPGNYTLLYDWLDTIRFRVYPHQQDCQAYFTYTHLKCEFEKCINTVAFQDSSKGDVVSWFWEFGDGKGSEEKNPVHTYENPGVYEVCLKIKTSDGCTSTWCEKVPVGPTDRCKAYFETIYPDCYTNDVAGCLSNHVAFIDRSLGDVINWHWDFGDGQTSDEQNPVHYYEKPGIYEVCLTIHTFPGCTDTYCDTVYIRLPRCKADFTWEPLRCAGDLTRCYGSYQFIDMSFSKVIRWYWDFGDGHTSASQNPVHAYENKGVYQVSLTIQTAYGCMDTKTDTLFFGDTIYPRCKADFRWDPLLCFEGFAPCPRSFYFTDLSKGDPIKWYWNFGDGDTSTVQNPVHTYPYNGRFIVSLIINTPSGCSDIKLDTIVVGDTLPHCCRADFEWEELIPFWDCGPGWTDCITPFYYVQFKDMSRGPVWTWEWDFGDGTVSTEQNPFHEYKFAGTYDVCLKIICAGWCYDVICRTITVGDTIPGPCKADFTVSHANLVCPTCIGCWCVQFIDQSSMNTVEWLWSFGDCDTSIIRNPRHDYYWFPGDPFFKVCLRIKTSDHCMDTICKMYDPQSGTLVSGLNEISRSSEELTLYPNPASDELHIQLSPEVLNKECRLTITDMYGRQVGVYSYDRGENGNGTVSLSIANLNNGQYICTVVADNKLYKSRFIVTK